MILNNRGVGLRAASESPQIKYMAPSATTGRVGMTLLGVAVLGLLLATDAWAGGTGTTMPWNTPMQTLLNNMTGPTARILVGIATAFAGYKWMFQSHEQGANNLARVTVGGAIALTAQTIISYASFGGALL